MSQELSDFIVYAKAGADLAKTVDAPGLISRFRSLFSRAPTPGRDWKSEALELLHENALEKLSNVELTIEQAFLILGNDFDWDAASDPSQTWINHWISATSNVGVEDQDRRTWWANLLAGEIQQPGAFSLRTISIMDVLAPVEAQLFTNLSRYVWTDYPTEIVALNQRGLLILPRDDSSLWRPSVNEGLELQAAGLVTRQAVGYRTPVADGETYRFGIGDTVVTLAITQQGGIRRGPLMLTEAGEQIYHLTNPGVDQPYFQELLEEWKGFAGVSIKA